MAARFSFSKPAILTPVPTRSAGARYAIAILCAISAVLVRWMLDPVLGHVAFYVTVYIAVAYCTFLCGYGPGIVSGALAFMGVFYWFVDPRRALWPVRRSDFHGAIGCFMVSTVLILLGEANRSKHLRLNQTVNALTTEATERHRAEAELRRAHDELEQRVRERTSELSATLTQLESEILTRERTESQLRRLSLRVMSLQDEERRRIARELHDSAGQTLAAMKMSVAMLRRMDRSSPKFTPLLDDLDALADEALQEVRTTSYLLHPPLLDEAGIASAARWFVEGFSRRSGVAIQFEIAPQLQRPSREYELVLFRVLQESLTNVHRHSGASAAKIRIGSDAQGFLLEVSDNGKGIPEERLSRMENTSSQAGVGITGMRERVRELGGFLEITSESNGTTIRAHLPATVTRNPADIEIRAEVGRPASSPLG